jgi:hypothetical protein
MDDATLAPENVPTFFYMFAAIFALSACWLIFRFVIRRDRQSKAGRTPDMHGLSEALTCTALTLGLAGFGFLVSIW